MSARDIRYGRRGGGWTVERQGSDVCDTCRNGTVRFQATHNQTKERWLVCGSCEAQGRKHRADVTYQALDRAPNKEGNAA